MRAWLIYHYGTNKQLTYSENIALPRILSPNELLIKVSASSVNPIDIRRRGSFSFYSIEKFIFNFFTLTQKKIIESSWQTFDFLLKQFWSINDEVFCLLSRTSVQLAVLSLISLILEQQCAALHNRWSFPISKPNRKIFNRIRFCFNWEVSMNRIIAINWISEKLPSAIRSLQLQTNISEDSLGRILLREHWGTIDMSIFKSTERNRKFCLQTISQEDILFWDLKLLY